MVIPFGPADNTACIIWQDCNLRIFLLEVFAHTFEQSLLNTRY